MITKIGVSEFRLPVRAPSIFVSAIQNKKAGKKLPSQPLSNTYRSVGAGKFLSERFRKGSITRPEDNIRNAATW